MKRVLAIAATGLALFAVPVALLSQGMPPTLVETGVVKTMEFHDQITLVGNTEARSNSRVVSEVAGRVIKINAPEGVAVKAGQTLVSIDPRRTQYALEAIRARVAQAQAQADLARKELSRTKNLEERDLAAEGKLDEDTAEQVRAVEFYNQLLAEQKQLELDLAHCSVRSPFHGFTIRKLVDVGEGVAIGTPVYEVVDLSTVKVTVDLPERYFGQVEIGSDVMIRITSSDDPVVGKVTGFAPNASEDTHTFPVIVNVDNADNRLGGGMLVRATVSLKDVFTSLAVHKDAIVRQGAQTMVYTINEGKAAPVPVVTGSMSGDMVAISGDAVKDGMTVVVRGNERIFPGSAVRTADGAQGQAPAGEKQSAENGDSKGDGETASNGGGSS